MLKGDTFKSGRFSFKFSCFGIYYLRTLPRIRCHLEGKILVPSPRSNACQVPPLEPPGRVLTL